MQDSECILPTQYSGQLFEVWRHFGFRIVGAVNGMGDTVEITPTYSVLPGFPSFTLHSEERNTMRKVSKLLHLSSLV